MSSAARPPHILLLVRHRGNRRRLEEWTREAVGGAVVADETEEPDLVVADPAAFVGERATIERLRHDARPVFLPCLLICAPREAARLGADVWHTADDVVVTPIRPHELRLRVRRLLDQRAATARADNERVELRRSNVDLERFAFVAAHELIGPLTIVNGAVHTLAGRIAADETDAAILAAALDGCRRMQTLIHDILDLSRAGRGGKHETVDTRAMLADICEELRDRIDTSGATVAYDGLPTVTADAAQLRLVFRNLVGNALKFRRVDVPAQVSVTATAVGERWEFRVTDNGVGVDPDQREGMFDLFARSDAHGDIPGSGIGLATCRRVVERHGGRIWIEPSSGPGTIVAFTLPFAEANAR